MYPEIARMAAKPANPTSRRKLHRPMAASFQPATDSSAADRVWAVRERVPSLLRPPQLAWSPL